MYGGVNQGLMECLGKATKEAGGRTIGIIPMIVEKSGRMSDYVDIEIPCDNLTDRKQLMMDQSDVFIALPGGIGTIDEVFTVAASATIGYHDKLVILYNMKDYWNPLIAMLDELQKLARLHQNSRFHRRNQPFDNKIRALLIARLLFIESVLFLCQQAFSQLLQLCLIGRFHARADGDHWLYNLTVLQTLNHRVHHFTR